MGLQARGTAGVDSASTGGTWDISNADRLGKSEIELVNIFIEGLFLLQILIYFPNLGVAQIIRWEQALEKGENIESEVSQAGLPKTVTIEVICESVGSFYCFSGPIYVHPWYGTLS